MDWITTANGIIGLISGLIGLLGAGVGVYFAIKNFIDNIKLKQRNEIWLMILAIADAAMKEAEATMAAGADKKTIAMESIKKACASAGLDITDFIDQLDAYIDDTIAFVNQMNNISQKESV